TYYLLPITHHPSPTTNYAKNNGENMRGILKKFPFSIGLILVVFGFAYGQRVLNARPTNSGGPLIFQQAAYDVKSYDITARIYSASQTISGTTVINARIVIPTNAVAIDLDTPYEISDLLLEVAGKYESVDHERKGDKIFVQFPFTKQAGETMTLKISYSGKPRVAPNPPWVGGFMWKKTANGSDWIANANQNDGADLWFPCKDHPSDEPDSVNLHITVPEDLYVASVGTLKNVVSNSDKTKTYNWAMSNGINNYNIVLNIAPYKIIEQSFKSISGVTFPVRFYALPEDAEKAKDIVAQTVKFLRFYEKFLGPYPYRAEKLGIAQTPHLGMEHSTIIAYGNNFKNNADGFDGLMLHELGHEWWGNLVTASDWRDMWIHEGFESFMDVLYLEETKGRDA
ncbi:MAG: M1 family metallopeptidase, partial [Acidobacteria bacterium]|nr:M1 family metallopeptidase [Acidobacteriota bacterium]